MEVKPAMNPSSSGEYRSKRSKYSLPRLEIQPYHLLPLLLLREDCSDRLPLLGAAAVAVAADVQSHHHSTKKEKETVLLPEPHFPFPTSAKAKISHVLVVDALLVDVDFPSQTLLSPSHPSHLVLQPR